MLKNYDIHFHLGLPKVASTYLQSEIFPHLNNSIFYRKREFLKYKEIDSSNLSSNIIFSSEKDRGLEEELNEILKYHPNAKVILSIRRQDDWVLSKYKYYIRKHGSLKFHDFINVNSNNGIWKKEELLFRNKIEYIIKHCIHPPLILNYDLLKSSPDLFIKKITTFTGSSINTTAKINKIYNKSFNEKQLIILRKFNQLYEYKEKKSRFKILNKIHYKYREFLLHTIGFLSTYVPSIFLKKKSLIDTKDLIKVREFYENDWKFCIEISK